MRRIRLEFSIDTEMPDRALDEFIQHMAEEFQVHLIEGERVVSFAHLDVDKALRLWKERGNLAVTEYIQSARVETVGPDAG